MEVTAEDLLAYVAAVVAHPSYTRRFRESLRTPGVRVPLSLDARLWRQAVEVGREVVWLHTFGESFIDAGAGRPDAVPLLPEAERPREVQAIPADAPHMPDDIDYDAATHTLILGEDTLFGPAGRIRPVSPQVWAYTVGGVPVIRRWFDYRRRAPRQRKRTSPLDDINPARWTAEFDDELFALLNVLGRCVALEPRQSDLLDRICAGPLISVPDLHREGVFPVPGHLGRPPRRPRQHRLPGL